MNLIAGQDRVLLGGLAVALIARFSRPIRALLELAQGRRASSGLAPMPALLIQAGGFLYHLQGKRQEARAHAAVAEADALQAGTRATVMEGLVTFGQAVVGNAKETRRDIERAREGRGAGDPHRRRVGVGRDCRGRPLCMPMTAGGHPVGVLGVLGVPESAGRPRRRGRACSRSPARCSRSRSETRSSESGAGHRELRRLGRAVRPDRPEVHYEA